MKLTTRNKPIVFRSGNPEEVAEKFHTLFTAAENAKLVIVAFGIYCFHIKFNLLKHGQFGRWVKSQGGSYRTVREHMLFTKSTFEAAKVKELTSLLAKWQTLPIYHSGEFLLLDEKKVPDEAKPIREKILNVLKGKTKRQLFSEWKQTEEDDDGEADEPKPPKRGNLSGKGNPTENRAAAAQIEEENRVINLNATAKSFEAWILANCNLKGFDNLTPETWKGLKTAFETGLSYMRRVEATQKGNQA